MLIALALVWTHTISSFVTAISGAGFAATVLIGACMEHRHPGRILTFAPVAAVFFVAAMLQHWLYAYYPDTPFFARTLSPFWQALESDATLLGTPFEPAPSMLNRVSFLVLIALAVWGGTGWLRPQARTPVRTAWMVAALCVAAHMFGFTSIGIRNLIPQRWLAFAFVLAAPALGRALSTISESVRPLKIGVGVTVLVTAIWAWFSLNTNFVNLNTPFYDVNTRYPYTESEQAAFAHIVAVHDGTTITDRVLWGDYAQYVAPSAFVYPLEADTQLPTVDSLFAIRQYARSQPDLMGEVARVESLIVNGQRLSVIYSNVQVELLLTQSR